MQDLSPSGAGASTPVSPEKQQPSATPGTKSQKIVDKLFKSKSEFTTGEKVLHTLSKWQPFAKDKWVRLDTNKESGSFYYVDVKRLSSELGINAKLARSLSSADKAQGSHMLLQKIVWQAMEKNDPSLLEHIDTPQLKKEVQNYAFNFLAEKILDGDQNGVDFLHNLLEGSMGFSIEQIHSVINIYAKAKIAPLLETKEIPLEPVDKYLTNILAYNPEFFRQEGEELGHTLMSYRNVAEVIPLLDKHQIVQRFSTELQHLYQPKEPKAVSYTPFIEEKLKQLDRLAIYARLQEVTGPERVKFMQELQQIAKNSPDLGLRKGAQNVLGAEYQASVLEALKANDTGWLTDLYNDCQDCGIPLVKLLKSYQTTTNASLSQAELTTLQNNVMFDVLVQAIEQNNPQKIKRELLAFCVVTDISPSELLSYMKSNITDLPVFVEPFLQQVDSFLQVFNGSNDLDTCVVNAKTLGLDVTELINFALEIHKSQKMAPNEQTKAAKLLALSAAQHTALPLAEELYAALINRDQETIRRVMHQVRDSGFAYDFHLFLEMAQKERQTQMNDPLVSRVIEIYSAMGALPLRSHNMSPYELVQCAIVAERELGQVAKRAERKEVPQGRDYVADLANREISFLNKSKGGSLYVFGGLKKVTSAITIATVWEGAKPRYTAFSSTEAVIRKDEITRNIGEWQRDLQAFADFKGLEGILQCKTVVDYTTEVGGVAHQRQAILLPNYDIGSFGDLRRIKPPVENLCAYYAKISKGLYNMHNYVETLPNGEKKVVPRVHGDLKPGNLLAATNGDAVISDFGFLYCPTKGEEMLLRVPYYGTPTYSAPEVTIAALRPHTRTGFNRRALAKLDQPALDCFAIGVSMYETLNKAPPESMKLQGKNYAEGHTNGVTAEEVRAKHVTEYEQAIAKWQNEPQTAESEYMLIAWEMMHPDPTKRMNAQEYQEKMKELAEKYPAVFV